MNAGTVWHQVGALRRTELRSREAIGRDLAGGNAALVDVKESFGLEEEDGAEAVVVDSDGRVVRFVGDSTGGGKSLG